MTFFIENYLFPLGFKISMHTIVQRDLNISSVSMVISCLSLFCVSVLSAYFSWSSCLFVYCSVCLYLYFMELTKVSMWPKLLLTFANVLCALEKKMNSLLSTRMQILKALRKIYPIDYVAEECYPSLSFVYFIFLEQEWYVKTSLH